MRLKGW